METVQEKNDELKALRALVHAAARTFEFQGLAGTLTPKDILLETLLCAQSDLGVISDASHTGMGAAEDMVFRRAELRIDLGIALAEYCEEFGWPEKQLEAGADASETTVAP
jgi:hypothetical protein